MCFIWVVLFLFGATAAFAQSDPGSVTYQGARPLDNAPMTFQQVVTPVATALASEQYHEGFWVKAPRTNQADIYLGGPLDSPLNGFPLSPGEVWFFHMDESDLLYVVGQNSTDRIAVSGN